MNKKGRKKNIQNYFMAAINLRFSVLFSRFVCAILFSLLLCLAFFFGLNGRFAYFLRALYVYSFVRALFYMKAENKNHLINPQTRIAILNCFSISFLFFSSYKRFQFIYTDIYRYYVYFHFHSFWSHSSSYVLHFAACSFAWLHVCNILYRNETLFRRNEKKKK